MFELVGIIMKWIKPILGVCLLAGIIAAAIGMQKVDEYSSKSVIIPASANLLERANLFNKEGAERPMYLFGGRHDLDRLITLSMSNDMTNHLIEEFDLMNHYGINPDASDAHPLLEKRLAGQLEIQKNSRTALEIKVFDAEPEKAAEIANSIASKLDELNKSMIMEKQREMARVLQKNISEKRTFIEKLTDSLNTMVNNNPADTIKHGVLRKIVKAELEDYNNAKSTSFQFDAVVNQDISSIYVVQKAVPSYKKARPNRTFQVLGSVLFTFFIMSLLSVFLEKFKSFRLES